MPDAGNKNLHSSKKAQADEFYTQLSTIENELRHYRRHFEGKTVLCNCDDPYESNFFRYFVLNFNRLGLRKLIATSYSGSPVAGTQLSLFGDSSDDTGEAKPYKSVVTGVRDATGDGGVDMSDVKELIRTGEIPVAELEGNGDFRSEESMELMREADIVVTNPPFSLMREYLPMLVEHGKEFLILGNTNHITFKEIFPYFVQGECWLGCSSGHFWFRVPDCYEPKGTDYKEDEDGRKWRRMGNICWFTNLDIKKRHEELILVPRYSAEKYPKYDNYDAIEVSKTADIPCDYDGIMGVPITFMDKYNPDQFEIIGVTESEGKGFSNGLWDSNSCIAQPLVEGKKLYKRIFIKNKHPEPLKERTWR